MDLPYEKKKKTKPKPFWLSTDEGPEPSQGICVEYFYGIEAFLQGKPFENYCSTHCYTEHITDKCIDPGVESVILKVLGLSSNGMGNLCINVFN
jgi:hypothetical protein